MKKHWKIFRFIFMWLYYWADLVDSIIGILSLGLIHSDLSFKVIFFISNMDCRYSSELEERIT
jgi:hypothetical protein